MDHELIEEQSVAERYVMGTLPPEDAERFEEHYFDCGECLERVRLADRFHEAIRGVAAEDAARGAVQLGFLAWLARASRSRQLGVALGALLFVVLVPAGLFLRQIGNLGGELERTRAELEDARGSQRRDAERAETLAGALAASRSELDAERERLAASTTGVTGEIERLTRELERVRRPRAGVPVVRLSPERGGPTAGEPSVRIVRPREPEPIVLVIELPAPGYDQYDAVLTGPTGEDRWQGSGLEADEFGSLTLTFWSSFLPLGDYEIRVAGRHGDGAPEPVTDYPFRIVAPV